MDHFRARLELARRPGLADYPGVIVHRLRRRAQVVDHLSLASRPIFGVSPSEARSLEPDVVGIEAHDSHYRQVFERMLCAFEQLSDRVDAAEPGVACVELDGLDPMYGGEWAMLTALEDVSADWRPQIGVEPSKLSAQVTARTRRSTGLNVVPTDTVAVLSPHSTELLPCPDELLGDLHRLGWRLWGDVGALHQSDLHERFGYEDERAGSWPAGPASDRCITAPEARSRGEVLAAGAVPLPGTAASDGRHAAHARLRATTDDGSR